MFFLVFCCAIADLGIYCSIMKLYRNYSVATIPQDVLAHIVSKSRDTQAKIPLPQAISNGFLLVTVKVLNSYTLS